MKNFNTPRIYHAILMLLILTSSLLSAEEAIHTKMQFIPMERIILQAKNQYGKSIVIDSAKRISFNEKAIVRLDFMDNNNPWRLVFDAVTGQETTRASLKQPMALEKILDKLSRDYSPTQIIKTALFPLTKTTVNNRELTRSIEFIDNRKKRWLIIMDAYTGLALELNRLESKPTGQSLAAEQLIKMVRQRYTCAVIIKTKMSTWKNRRVKEVTILTKEGTPRKILITPVTGEIIDDRISTRY
ncbi:hypothetical protein CI610_00421 [invertebrate metagenome]|uniref:PepSY domain-containing protein n=1 Tax=invertebrate metagenome TaxID=1711999 RepID=A0A2H9TBN3_9ZZZZ